MTIVASAARPRWLEATALVALGIAMAVVMVRSKETLYGVQGNAAAFAAALPFGYAFAAGLVAAFNPCGILLVPSLVAYYLGGDEAASISIWQRAARALAFGVVATLGFIVLFAAIGLVFVASGRAIAAYFPVGGLVAGIALASVGLWMIGTGHSFGIMGATRAMGATTVRPSLRSFFVFGLGYGVASLACTLPVFLVVVGTSLLGGNAIEAGAHFVAYALGMGTVLTSVIVGAAFFRSVVAGATRRIVPYVHGVMASLLLSAGLFLVVYWLQATNFFR